jgi:hypothetical protein
VRFESVAPDTSSFDDVSELTPTVFQLARKIEQARLEAGLGAEELLKSLREQRERYYLENYPPTQSKSHYLIVIFHRKETKTQP